MQKIACVFSFKMSSWVSCQKIVFNLHKAYQLDKNIQLLNFNYSPDQTNVMILKTANELIAAEPDVIIFLDHKPHPAGLLFHLKSFLKTKNPRIIFHVFGDFTLNYSGWDWVGKELVGLPVDFIVASERQKHLIDKFLPDPLKSHVCPFPVDDHEFSFVPALRKLQRKEWGLGEDDIALVFTGRLSRQKRIHLVLKAFAEFFEKKKADNFHLYLYGSPDHIGDQFLGRWESEGEYFSRINRIYKALPEKTRNNIHFMGAVPNSELKGVYQGADVLVNLSVHNDEDYGMSVAEAQCSGLPAVLTDWGGLAGFYHPELPEATKYIPVVIGQKAKLLDYQAVLRAFEDIQQNGPLKDRKKLSEIALSKLGIGPAHKIVSGVLDKTPGPFKGFTPFFEHVVLKTLFSPNLYIDNSRNINKLYRDIYSSYVRNH